MGVKGTCLLTLSLVSQKHHPTDMHVNFFGQTMSNSHTHSPNWLENQSCTSVSVSFASIDTTQHGLKNIGEKTVSVPNVQYRIITIYITFTLHYVL